MNNLFLQSRGSLFFPSCSRHHAPEVLWGSAFESKIHSMSRVPYNKLLHDLACSSRTGEYWLSVVFVRTSRCSVRTVTTSCQYSPVRPSRSVSKRLVSLLGVGSVTDKCVMHLSSSKKSTKKQNAKSLAFIRSQGVSFVSETVAYYLNNDFYCNN